MYRISILKSYILVLVYFVYFLIMHLVSLQVSYRSAQSGKWGPARHRRAHNACAQAQWMAEIK